MDTDERKCPECDRPIYGRVDKKFCSDACRNSYNNRVNSDTTNFVRNVNNTLRKNRRILLELNPDGETKSHRDKLLKKGFDFDFHTSAHTTVAGQTYYFCYDQGYLKLADGNLLLVVKISED